MNRKFFSMVLALLVLGGGWNLLGQGTAFNYQGRLSDAGQPANGTYDLRFAVYDAVTNGNRVSLWLTNSAAVVSNGLFTTTLDFGEGIFAGADRWLDIAVRKTNDVSFTTLSPRQPILPVPYAMFANSSSNVVGTVSATQLTGTVPSAQISGTYAGAVNFANSSNAFSGTFSGDGSALNHLNGSQVTSGTVADERLSTNVALLDHSQTFTGNNQFSGVNTFTNWANSFTGNFFGNGLVGWNTVSGTSQQAVRDHGYMLTSSSFTTVTLPLNSGLTNGDIVRVSGAGGGGWLVAVNSGQSIRGNLASYRNCSLIKLPSPGNTYSIAASVDRSRMFAVGGFYGVQISSDFGQTWSQFGNLAGYFGSVACSADGKVVYIGPGAGAGGTIKKSSDDGGTWSNISNNGTTVACTADGNTAYTGGIVCSGNGTNLAKLAGGVVYVSTDGGLNWSSINSPPATPTCLAASSDCLRLVAGVYNGKLYGSANRGASWTTITSTNQYWNGLWMSGDGSKLAASTINSGASVSEIYYANLDPYPNITTTNSIGGSQGSAVELQYIGNGQFMPVSSSGVIWAN